MSGLVVSGFAGPGGWCTGLRWAGWTGRNIGVEIDSAACETARAAGHERVQGDVSLLDPVAVSGGEPVTGLVMSPVCTTFSNAGRRSGRAELDKLAARVLSFAHGREPEAVGWGDPRTPLTAEPMRWVFALRPRWIALEQVPGVLPIWQHMAVLLRGMGYWVWTGALSAEAYGVPQTRERAILLASIDGPVTAPAPTHQRYVPHRDPLDAPDLFGESLPCWVSMADALGWGLDDRPSWTVSGGGTETGGAEVFANARNRRKLVETVQWQMTRPATTVCGDPRIAPPGHKNRAGGEPQFGHGTIRVTPAEAGVLQSFPADYPWRGKKGQQHQQAGDAVPPLLAMHVLRPLLSGASGAEVAA